MTAIRPILVAICLFLGSRQAVAQQYPFIRYTPKDGLISNRVHNLYQDSRGRILFMTANGLSIYDGARFINYGTENGLASPVVNDVLELSADTLLIATNTGILNALIRGVIATIPTADGFCPVINKFYRGKDHLLYVASDQGLYRYEKNTFFPVMFDNSNENHIRSIDDIFDLGDYYLLKRSHVSQKFSHLLLLHKKSLQAQTLPVTGVVSCVLPVKEEQLLLIIARQEIFSFDLNAAERGVLKMKELPGRFKNFKKHQPVKIVIDQHRNTWCITTNAVIRIRDDGQSQVYNNSNGLDVNYIRSISVDRENVLWVLTDGSGVLKLVNGNIELLSPDIRAVYEDRSGKIWMLAASGRRLTCTYGDLTQSWELPEIDHLMGLGMRQNKLLLFNYHSIHETVPAKGSRRLSLKKIFDYETDSLNFSRIEIGADHNIYIPGKLLTIIKYNNQVFRLPLPYYVDQVCFDRQQQLWAVSRRGHLLCYRINNNDSARPLTLQFTGQLNIPEPRSIVVDQNGKIWIGTRYAGLYCLDYKNGKIKTTTHWTASNGLTDNFVFYLSCDSNNVIWAGTQGGLDRISSPGFTVESITRNNNIFQVVHKTFIGAGNKVWAMGSGGILCVKNDPVMVNHYQPQVQIIRIMNGNKDLGLLPDGMVFPARTGELTIDAAAPSFIDEKRVLFSYRLEGGDESQWSAPSTDASFRFINLQPATYTLRIKAIFPVAGYKINELGYRFTILPPWWQTWWFRSVLFLVVLAAVIAGIKAYYHKKLRHQKSMLEKQQAIQQERTRIAMEMHDDLGSGLTVIRYLANGLVSHPLPLIKENALKIETSAKQLVDSMNDIIWTIKSDNNLLSDVLIYIRKQAADMLENVGINYRFDFSENLRDIILTNEQKRNLLLISKEIIHNIIKHAHATQVTITARQSGRYLHLRFSDNGKGIEQNQVNVFGNGLKNIRKRAEQIGGQIEIFDKEGTTILVRIALS